MKKSIANSYRIQMVLSVFGVFMLLLLSTAYILFSTVKMQELADDSFKQERYLKSIRESLNAYQAPLTEYLSTRSSNALARLLIDSQALRKSLPERPTISRDPTELREREVFSLIRAYLDLADVAVDEKRGRNIAGYIELYDELRDLLAYVDTEIDSISTERFRARLDDYGIFIRTSRNILQWNLLFIVFVSLFAMSLLLRAVERMAEPMGRLSAMATELSAGNFDMADIEKSAVYEIDHVVEAFNQMKNEIRSYIEEIRWQENIKQEYMQERMRNMKMEELVRRMEVYTMQAQMNPHFLFNTLNTGMQLAIVEGADRTGEYMDCLSRLFRHNVRNKDIIVPLRHEIEGLKLYFRILEIRFPKNLDLSLDYPEEAMDSCAVPVAILQPLVENCVIHAFKNSRSRNCIVVRAARIDSRLELTVADNGCGIPRETIDRLLSPQGIDETASRVMGLENVIQRLYFFYPPPPGVVRIESAPDEGTAITITIDTDRKPCIES